MVLNNGIAWGAIRAVSHRKPLIVERRLGRFLGWKTLAGALKEQQHGGEQDNGKAEANE